MPSTLSWEEAASIPIVFLTAYHALARTAQLAAGETVLIHSAMGGLGQAAIQIARHLGATVFASAGSEAKRDALRDVHRVARVTDSHSLNFARDALEWTRGAGVDVILNSLAGEYIDAGMRCLRPGGRFVEVGKRDISEGGSVGLKPFNHNLQFLSVQLDQLMLRRPEIVGDIAAAIVRQIAASLQLPRSNCLAFIVSLIFSLSIHTPTGATFRKWRTQAGAGDQVPDAQGGGGATPDAGGAPHRKARLDARRRRYRADTACDSPPHRSLPVRRHVRRHRWLRWPRP